MCANSLKPFHSHSTYHLNVGVIDAAHETKDSKNRCESAVKSFVETVESLSQSYFLRVQRAKEIADKKMSESKSTWADFARCSKR